MGYSPMYRDEKRYMLTNGGFYLGGMALHNTGFRNAAQLHLFTVVGSSGAIKFCTKAAASIVIKSLLAHGLKGWKVEEIILPSGIC